MPVMRSTLVLSKYLGGLGNRLMIHIHVMAFAMEHGFSLVNLTLHRDARLFEGLWANSWCRYPSPAFGLPLHAAVRGARGMVEALARIGEKDPGSIPGLLVRTLGDGEFQSMEDPGFVAACREHRWINLQGWLFRANACVLRHRDAIRNFLRFRRSLHPRLSSLLDESRSQGKTRVCLHVRQGDFRHWEGGRHFIPPEDYAEAACRIARTETGRNLEFWVCSDEPVDLAPFPTGTRTAPNRTLAEDFQVMTESDFILGGISTFSRTAAFLGDARFHIHQPGFQIPQLGSWNQASGAMTI